MFSYILSLNQFAFFAFVLFSDMYLLSLYLQNGTSTSHLCSILRMSNAARHSHSHNNAFITHRLSSACSIEISVILLLFFSLFFPIITIIILFVCAPARKMFIRNSRLNRTTDDEKSVVATTTTICMFYLKCVPRLDFRCCDEGVEARKKRKNSPDIGSSRRLFADCTKSLLNIGEHCLVNILCTADERKSDWIDVIGLRCVIPYYMRRFSRDSERRLTFRGGEMKSHLIAYFSHSSQQIHTFLILLLHTYYTNCTKTLAEFTNCSCEWEQNYYEILWMSKHELANWWKWSGEKKLQSHAATRVREKRAELKTGKQ